MEKKRYQESKQVTVDDNPLVVLWIKRRDLIGLTNENIMRSKDRYNVGKRCTIFRLVKPAFKYNVPKEGGFGQPKYSTPFTYVVSKTVHYWSYKIQQDYVMVTVTLTSLFFYVSFRAIFRLL